MKRKFDAAKIPQFIALESVSVASPCHADWDAMTGDERSRFCPSCAKNVYNLSAMTRDEAQFLLQEKEGRLCVRYFLRDDGTMLTQDCPVGVAALKERSPSFALWAGVASLALFAAALVSPSFLPGAQAQPDPRSNQTTTPTSTPEPKAPPVDVRMGDFAVAPLPTTASVPTVTPQTSATTIPALSAELGQVTNATAPTPVPKIPPTMGKIAVLGRVATPSRQAPPTATPQPTPTPQATVTPKPVPPPMMGAIAIPLPPQHKPETPSNPKSSRTNRR